MQKLRIVPGCVALSDLEKHLKNTNQLDDKQVDLVHRVAYGMVQLHRPDITEPQPLATRAAIDVLDRIATGDVTTRYGIVRTLWELVRWAA